MKLKIDMPIIVANCFVFLGGLLLLGSIFIWRSQRGAVTIAVTFLIFGTILSIVNKQTEKTRLHLSEDK